MVRDIFINKLERLDMKHILLILLFALVAFVQVDFAQKKFIAKELSLSEGLNGNKITKQFILMITPTSLTVLDARGIIMYYKATGGTFGIGKTTTAYNTVTNRYCTVSMYKNTVSISEGRIMLFYKGTFYY